MSIPVNKHHVRLASSKKVQIENAAGTAWVDALKLDSSDKPLLGASSSNAAAMTPVPTGAAGSITTQTSTGRWCRIGPLVFVNLKVVITDVGTATGDLTITLPSAVPASADASLDTPLALSFASLNYGAGDLQVTAKILSNTKTIKLYASADDGAGLIVDAENMTVEVAGCYLAE